MLPRELIRYVGGVPLLDEGCDIRRLMSFAALLRAQIDRVAADQAARYLDPERACELYRRHARGVPHAPDVKAFNAEERTALNTALDDIRVAYPEWSVALSVPIRFLSMRSPAASLTNRLLPQCIFLGEAAFASSSRLQETLVHEYSHVLCGLLAEAYDFQERDAPSTYTLPSGLSGKGPRGLLLAALFAASATQYYKRLQRMDSPSFDAARLLHLKSYLSQVVETLETVPGLSTMGRCVFESLLARLPAIA